MLNGLDLFSGIGGIALALGPWVRPVAYCEIDRYGQAVLLSRMSEGRIPVAPIWDDVRTLAGRYLPTIDIIYGGFPCQDISVAGAGAGLAGERSGLFYEIARLCGELRPDFVYLENVPAITSRGGADVVGTLTALGYDCRWCVISAAEVGANHLRERWFLLAHANGGRQLQPGGMLEQIGGRIGDGSQDVSHTDSKQHESGSQAQWGERTAQLFPDASGEGLQERQGQAGEWPHAPATRSDWWATEPDVGRVAHGVPFRVDRIKGLGNAVVPLQARTAFRILMGLGT